MKKVLLSVALVLLTLGVHSQTGGPTTDPTTNPSGVGFGGATPSGTTTNPPVTIPSPGAVPGNISDPGARGDNLQRQQERTTPGVRVPNSPSTFPDTTPAIPDATVPAEPSIPGERTVPATGTTSGGMGTGR
ncbi:MAG: hypothetical protein ACLGHN_10835 [Bacteriovoracia bacterium]